MIEYFAGKVKVRYTADNIEAVIRAEDVTTTVSSTYTYKILHSRSRDSFPRYMPEMFNPSFV
jgi:hypothetical protein